MALLHSARVRVLFLIGLALGLFGCDEATKSAAKATLANNGPVEVVRGAVDLHYVENDDIAFNAFRLAGLGHSPLFLAILGGIGIVAALALAIAAKAWCARVGLSLVLGGALGNVADRVVRGVVVDFIHVHGWPVFNVADIAVVVGIALLFLSRLRRDGEDEKPSPAA